MSLIRQVWLMLLGVLLLSLFGSLATLVLTSRETLQTQLRVRNADAATMLALALSQQRGEPELMRLVALAQFDTGHYRQIRLLAPGGAVLFERAVAPQPGAAPAWFSEAFSIEADAGQALVSDGWRNVGRLEVAAQAAWAVDSLWAGCVRAVGLLALLGVLAAGVAALAVRSWRRPLQATVEQARALEEGRFVQAPEPQVPELRRLARSMNSLVRRLQLAFETQAEQVQVLRLQATTDPVTGLPHRRQFVSQVDAALRDSPARGGALLIIRLRHLNDLNERLGHDTTDRLLSALADVLQAYPQRAPGALCGRLNGSDFGLFLPAPGLAAETASSLVMGLRAALAGVDDRAQVVIGGADPLRGNSVAGALALADAALLRADAQGPFAVEVAVADGAAGPLSSEQAWREALTLALAGECFELAQYAVRDKHERLLHVECPLRIQLLPGGPYEPASVWLWMAARAQLSARADLAALHLALAAAQHDGQRRCIHVAGASLGGPGFIADVARALAELPQAARVMAIEVNESFAAEHTQRLGEANRAWRVHGVRLGLEHAGAALQGLARLGETGIDYIKIDDRYVHGVGSNPAVREFARSLATLAHSMGMQVIAAGVDDAEDLRTLWALGFDGVTGPAVRALSEGGAAAG